jgi:hypothetical protein
LLSKFKALGSSPVIQNKQTKRPPGLGMWLSGRALPACVGIDIESPAAQKWKRKEILKLHLFLLF